MKPTDRVIMQKYAGLAARADDRVLPPGPSVLIMSTPRSGSTYVCDRLCKTGVLGQPDEWFNPRYMAAFVELFKFERIPVDLYVRFIRNTTATPNGAFCVKVHAEHIEYWRLKGFDIPGLGFDVMVSLVREDERAQAVSLATAIATDDWFGHDTALDRDALVLSDREIEESLVRIRQQTKYMHEQFAGRFQRCWTYEGITGPQGDQHFRDLLELAGIRYEGPVPPSGTRKLSNPERNVNLSRLRR